MATPNITINITTPEGDIDMARLDRLIFDALGVPAPDYSESENEGYAWIPEPETDTDYQFGDEVVSVWREAQLTGSHATVKNFVPWDDLLGDSKQDWRERFEAAQDALDELLGPDPRFMDEAGLKGFPEDDAPDEDGPWFMADNKPEDYCAVEGCFEPAVTSCCADGSDYTAEQYFDDLTETILSCISELEDNASSEDAREFLADAATALNDALSVEHDARNQASDYRTEQEITKNAILRVIADDANIAELLDREDVSDDALLVIDELIDREIPLGTLRLLRKDK